MFDRHSRRRRRPRRGFVLVLTLLLLALVATVVAGAASQSMQVAMQATQQREDLQRSWGAISARRALLDRAEAVFDALDDTAAAQGSLHRAEVNFSVSLGGFDFEVRLSDEDAKVNLNAALALTSLGRVNRLAERLVYIEPDTPTEVFLRPNRAGRDGSVSFAPFETWGQVFSLQTDTGGDRGPDAVRRSSRNLTCWGSGRLNVCRASDDALRELCRLVVADIVARRLVQERQRLAEVSSASLLDRVRLRPEPRARLTTILTDRSSCYSIWITARSIQRQWDELHVVCAGGQGSAAGGHSSTSGSFRSVADFKW